MADIFADAMTFVLRWEGGFVDNPHDPGGRTMRGVTQAVYNIWRAAHSNAGDPDVKNIVEADLQDIYRQNYWVKASCDVLRPHLNLVTFDTAVNMGPVRAVKILQRVLGLDQDGVFGDHTHNACDACDPVDAARTYCNTREAIYNSIVEAKPDQKIFLNGWLNRLNALRQAAGIPTRAAIGPDQATQPIADLTADAPLDIDD